MESGARGVPPTLTVQNDLIWTVLTLIGILPVSTHIGGSGAFSLAFSITQRDVVPSAKPDADREPCAVWLA
jgi:hypothetical protein